MKRLDVVSVQLAVCAGAVLFQFGDGTAVKNIAKGWIEFLRRSVLHGVGKGEEIVLDFVPGIGGDLAIDAGRAFAFGFGQVVPQGPVREIEIHAGDDVVGDIFSRPVLDHFLPQEKQAGDRDPEYAGDGQGGDEIVGRHLVGGARFVVVPVFAYGRTAGIVSRMMEESEHYSRSFRAAEASPLRS